MLRKWLNTSHTRKRAVRSLFSSHNKTDPASCSPPISPWHGEPTLEEILSDPITGALMKADGVEAYELQAMLRRITQRRDAMQRGDLHFHAD